MNRLERTRTILNRNLDKISNAKKEYEFENEQSFSTRLEIEKTRIRWVHKRTYSGVRKDNVRDSNKEAIDIYY